MIISFSKLSSSEVQGIYYKLSFYIDSHLNLQSSGLLNGIIEPINYQSTSVFNFFYIKVLLNMKFFIFSLSFYSYISHKTIIYMCRKIIY